MTNIYKKLVIHTIQLQQYALYSIMRLFVSLFVPPHSRVLLYLLNDYLITTMYIYEHCNFHTISVEFKHSRVAHLHIYLLIYLFTISISYQYFGLKKMFDMISFEQEVSFQCSRRLWRIKTRKKKDQKYGCNSNS